MVRWLGILLLLVAVFHRPLFHHGARFVLIQVAARQHLSVDLHLSGTIFTNLTATGIRVFPTGTAPSPVRRIEIERLRLDYSIIALLKHGIGELLRSYEIVNSTLELEALPSSSEPERQEKRAIAETLNTILGQPAFYADRVRIQNFNITVRSQDTLTQISGFHLMLDPEQPGYLQVERLQVPGAPVWSNLRAETSYTARNFFIKRLELSPELIIEEFNFDASQRSKNKGGIQLQARAFGGVLALNLSGSQLNKKGENLEKSYDTTLKISASDVSLEKAAAYFGAPKPPVARLANLTILFTGEPEKPRTWKGSLAAKVEALAFDQTKIDSAGLAVSVANGRAELTAGNISAGRNSVNLTAHVILPESVNDFPGSDVDASVEIAAPDLPALTAMLPEPMSGAVTGSGPIRLHAGKVETDLALEVKDLASGKIEMASAKLRLKASKRLVPAPPSPLDELESNITLEAANLHFQEFSVDSIRLDVENHGDLITVRTLGVHRAENSVTAHGTYRVPRDPKDAAASPIDAEFSIQAPRLETFGIVANGHTLSGHLDGTGLLKMNAGALGGEVRIAGGDFRLGEFQTGPLAVRVTVANNVASIEECSLTLASSDRVVLTGTAAVQPPFAYEAGVVIDFKSLAALQPLLGAFGAKQTISGALHVDWSGKGEAAKPAGVAGIPIPPPGPSNPAQPAAPPEQALSHSGRLALALSKGRLDKIDVTEVKLSGDYSPEFAELTELRLVSGPTTFTGELAFRDGQLKLGNMHLQQANISVLTGEIQVPLELKNSKQPVPFDQPLLARISASKLDLEKLLTSLGQTPPVNGVVTANLEAEGTIQELSAQLKVSGRMLKSKAAAQLEPAEFDLDVKYAANEITLLAGLRQREIQPLTIRGHVPLDLGAILGRGSVDLQSPIEAAVQLPPTSLAVVSKFTPLVRRLDGTAGVDVRVSGTLEKPVFSGSAALEIKNARMTDENIPVLDSFHGKLSFANDTLTLNAFDGGLGGGKFKAGGSIKFPKLTEPAFDLHLEAKEVLVRRDDSITVRADTDIRVAGPLNAMSLSGGLFITHSRFFKEIDILPIALPGKAKPAPKSVQNQNVNISFPNPPLRDCKFDVTIKTRPNDSFLVRGNLANGAAAIDLHLGGTGLNPYLEGNIHIEEFNATLPFSTLSVSRGFVYFTRDSAFQPSLDLQADSQIRDYTVHAYIYGKASDPQVQLASEPPLQYSDIVALLATGTTATELGNNADVLASRAAILAVQQLYRKMFHRGEAPPEEKGNLLQRFQFELGAVDNRTGEQQVMSRVKLTDQLYLLGDLGFGGRFTGGLKYLIRFR